MSNSDQDLHTRKSIAKASSVAFAAALLIFLTIVMPAEFGRDPLGTGGLLGLDRLAYSTADALHEQSGPHKLDTVEFILEPFQSLEYKYMMDRGQGFVFSWQADGELTFDMHAENFEVPDGEESYAQLDGNRQAGLYEAAFNGMHGWFWENRTFQEVTLRLHVAGFFISATEYRGGSSADRQPAPVLPE